MKTIIFIFTALFLLSFKPHTKCGKKILVNNDTAYFYGNYGIKLYAELVTGVKYSSETRYQHTIDGVNYFDCTDAMHTLISKSGATFNYSPKHKQVYKMHRVRFISKGTQITEISYTVNQ